MKMTTEEAFVKVLQMQDIEQKRRLGLLKVGILLGDRAVEKSDERFRSKESAGY